MTIAVVLLTYNRLEYAKRTLESAILGLKSIDHDIRWHIASDGDSLEYMQELWRTFAKAGIDPTTVTVSNSERGGYGRNYNLAMQTVHQYAEWVMPLEDDWELLRPFNPDELIRDMLDLNIGCARLGYIGYTQDLRGVLRAGRAGHWLYLDSTSPEPHVFAGHPRIERVSWSREVGPWTEGLMPGDTEFEVAHRRAARRGVGWPLDVVRPRGDLFAHIGTVRSW